jgi:hypothetical protein
VVTAPTTVQRFAESADPGRAPLLATESTVVWRHLSAQSAPWLRELFPSDRRHWEPDDNTWAYTGTADGMVIREFRCSDRSLATYAALVLKYDGSYGPPPSSPLEAVLPCSICPGKPAISAHAAIRSIATWLGHSLAA